VSSRPAAAGGVAALADGAVQLRECTTDERAKRDVATTRYKWHPEDFEEVDELMTSLTAEWEVGLTSHTHAHAHRYPPLCPCCVSTVGVADGVTGLWIGVTSTHCSHVPGVFR
jgi:hypothetical protein